MRVISRVSAPSIRAIALAGVLMSIPCQAQDVSIADARAVEGGAAITFTVRLSSASDSLVTVDYRTGEDEFGYRAGLATGGLDYVETSGSISFAPGETVRTIAVPILDDDEGEGEEAFLLSASSDDAYIEQEWAYGVILDDEALPFGCGGDYCYVRFPIRSVYDAGTGTWRPGAGSVRVKASFEFDGHDWSEDDWDYRARRYHYYYEFTRIVTSSGRVGARERDADGLESFWDCRERFDVDEETGTRVLREASVSRDTSVSGYCTDAGHGFCRFSMRASDDADMPDGCWDLRPTYGLAFDYDELPRLGAFTYTEDGYVFGPASFSREPQVTVSDARTDGERGTVSFTVSLDLASTARTTVDYATSNGSAVAGADYLAANGTLVFEPGQVRRTVTVGIVEDGLIEGDETFNLVLSNVVGAVAWRSIGTATIEDDDLGSLAQLRLADPLVSGCITTTGGVWLSEPAPPGGIVVALHSDNPHVVVPASVKIYQGTLARRFQIRTSPVAARETATIEASVPGQTVDAILTLRPMGSKSLVLAPNPVVGGTSALATVTLQCPAGPGDVLVTMSSSQPDVAYPSPAEFLVPAGTQVVTFDLLTTPVTRVRSPSITAAAGETQRRRPLTVTPVP